MSSARFSTKSYSPENIWFTSDHHFGHEQIIFHCNRPFANASEMDDKMVENWNSLVKPNDMVFHLGDFCFGSIENWKAIRSRLNGTIRLIRGNHDKFQTGQISDLFESVNDYLKIRVKDEDGNQGWQFLILSHYAFRVWDQCHHNSFHLYAHSHGNLPDDPNSLSFDVGVDCHDFCPISYDQVKQIMSKKTGR